MKTIQRLILCVFVVCILLASNCLVDNCRAIDYMKAKCSWYGPGFHGRLMANGERYDMNNPAIVAHKKLPFGTIIQFRNGDKTATAIVKDRGPYIAGREFDLSKGLAEKLGTIGSGVATLEYRILYNKLWTKTKRKLASKYASNADVK